MYISDALIMLIKSVKPLKKLEENMGDLKKIQFADEEVLPKQQKT